MTNFPELFQYIHQNYGIELNVVQKSLIEKVLLSRQAFTGLSNKHKDFLMSLPDDDFNTETALLRGHRIGLSRATIFRILGNEALFIKLGHGLYQRLF